MKCFILVFCLWTCTISVSRAQSKYKTTNGEVHFNASTPLEDIDALNTEVNAIMDTASGKFAVVMLIKDFKFPKKLMQEHFNENYMESEEYPKAFFSGTIQDFNWADINSESVEKIISGKLTIHGVTRDRTEKIRILKKGSLMILDSKFTVMPEDHNVEVPKIVFTKIAREVQVDFNLELKVDK